MRTVSGSSSCACKTRRTRIHYTHGCRTLRENLNIYVKWVASYESRSRCQHKTSNKWHFPGEFLHWNGHSLSVNAGQAEATNRGIGLVGGLCSWLLRPFYVSGLPDTAWSVLKWQTVMTDLSLSCTTVKINAHFIFIWCFAKATSGNCCYFYRFDNFKKAGFDNEFDWHLL